MTSCIMKTSSYEYLFYIFLNIYVYSNHFFPAAPPPQFFLKYVITG